MESQSHKQVNGMARLDMKKGVRGGETPLKRSGGRSDQYADFLCQRLSVFLILLLMAGCGRTEGTGGSGTVSNGNISLPVSTRLQKMASATDSALTAELVIDIAAHPDQQP